MESPSGTDVESASLTSDESTPQHLGVWDAVSIIIGIVVGTAIFKTPQLVFANVDGPWQGLGCWALGGVLALVGSLCYAELATTYPRMGGDYVYLTRAFGRPTGFLFGWAQLVVILTSSIGTMAFAFADYAQALWNLDSGWGVWLAVGSVLVLTALNLLGVLFGKFIQNTLTIVKVAGLAVIFVAGMGWGADEAFKVEQPMTSAGFGLAMVFVFYAFGGWNDAAFVAAEVRNRERNIPLALLLGTGGIMAIYLLVNLAYLWGLGFEELRKSSAPAADLMTNVAGPWGGRAMSLLVMMSALGAINGLIFTGSRIYVSLGADHQLFATLGRWNARRGAPIWSLVAQTVMTLVWIVMVGTKAGQNAVDRSLGWFGLSPLPWAEYFGGFNTLVAGTAPVFWSFFLLTCLSVFVLRFKDRGIKRPFSIPLFPLEPLVFAAMCGFMIYSAIDYAKGLSLLGLIMLAIGVPLYGISQWLGRRSKESK